MPKNSANFNVDNVRVVKILGGGAHDSKVVKGVVIKRSTEGAIQDVTDAKVAVFAQGVDTAATETKVRPILGPLASSPVTQKLSDSDGIWVTYEVSWPTQMGAAAVYYPPAEYTAETCAAVSS